MSKLQLLIALRVNYLQSLDLLLHEFCAFYALLNFIFVGQIFLRPESFMQTIPEIRISLRVFSSKEKKFYVAFIISFGYFAICMITDPYRYELHRI
jgi:hypothetical protein